MRIAQNELGDIEPSFARRLPVPYSYQNEAGETDGGRDDD
jgi:hypothetical protein